LRLICDANIIIAAHRHQIWHRLTAEHDIFIASSVKGESIYYDDRFGRHDIDLSHEISIGITKVIAVPLGDVRRIVNKIRNRIEIHIGEAESIAILFRAQYQDHTFCTSDKRAVYATHLLDGNLARVVSLEKCLGSKDIRNLPYECTIAAMERWKSEAIQLFGTQH
jgi:hypothetical protein